MGPKMDPELTPKWIQNGPKMEPKMDPKWTPNGPQMDPEWTPNGTRNGALLVIYTRISRSVFLEIGFVL